MPANSHNRWVVKLRNGLFLSSRRFDMRTGTHTAAVEFDHARLFTRQADASKSAGYCSEGARALPVTILAPIGG